MPPRSRTRASLSTSRQVPTNIDPTVFGALSTADLRSLCLQRGVPSTGVRKTLERRLRDLNTEVENNSETPVNNSETLRDTAPPAQVFTDGQMQKIKDLIKDTVQQSAREIASEAAKAAVNVIQASSSGDRLPGQQTPSVPGTSTAAVSFAAPFQEIPAQYVKDIQAGEFFDLSKLLPKNLSLYDDEYNLVLSLQNSVVKVTRKSKPSASTSITDIEQWTTAFTCYMSVLTHKFPTRSQELLQ